MVVNISSLDIFGINKKKLGEDKQGDEELQSYNRKDDISPIFSFKNNAIITAGSIAVVDFVTLKPKSEKYLPFNTMNILNNSSVNIEVYINQNIDRPIVVPSGLIMPINNTIAPAINSISWKNLDGSTSVAVDEVQFIVSRDNVTTDLVMKRLHQLLFRGTGLSRR